MWPMTSQEDVLQIERRAEEKGRCHWKMDSSRDSSGVYSSSSNESVIDNESDIYTEESDEEGGVVLVPKTRTEPEPRPERRGSAPVNQFSLGIKA